MFLALRRSLGLYTARFRFRASREKVISFTRTMPSARRLLVVMPLTTEDLSEQIALTASFVPRFSEKNITVVTSGGRSSIERAFPRSTVIAVAPEEITPFFLPRRALTDRVCAHEYDVAIDLNLDFMLPSAYICKVSKAGIRVGFSRPQADVFYNFQVRLDPAAQPGHAYKRLAHCLQMFFTKGDV